jgi:hypothetical protein
VHSVFVSATGQIYFTDRGLVRTVDSSGNVKTILGQMLISGDNGVATLARFNNINHLALKPNGKIVVLDNAESRIREFVLNGNITHLAGTGNASNLYSTVTDPKTQDIGISNLSIGDGNNIIVGHRGAGSSNYISKLADSGSGGLFSLFIGGGGTGLNNPLAETKLGNQVSNYGYAPVLVGFNGVNFLEAQHRFDGVGAADSLLIQHSITDGTVHKISGQIGAASSLSCGALPAALSGCALPQSASFLSATWDSTYGGYIQGFAGASTVYLLIPDGNISLLKTLPRAPVSLVFVRRGGQEHIYYCSANRIYDYNLTAVTDTLLPWSDSTLNCQGRDISYNSARDSIIFPVNHNTSGLNGVAEYILP